mmetsp:Transcript_19627/g.59375  ORF Transcript_19627/g.59375 Transcript_19627/m.59375 type:complete len:190 (+) Transcript_19627:7-576(+)
MTSGMKLLVCMFFLSSYNGPVRNSNRRGSLEVAVSAPSVSMMGGVAGPTRPNSGAAADERPPGAAVEYGAGMGACASTASGGDVLGLCRVRLTFRPIADFAAVAAVHQGPGQRAGVLLVQLQSASLLTTELSHPAVRLTVGKQVRQTAEYVSLHGGRVTWATTSFAFALVCDDSASPEVHRRPTMSCVY